MLATRIKYLEWLEDKQADADLNSRTQIIWQGHVNITLMTFFYLAALIRNAVLLLQERQDAII